MVNSSKHGRTVLLLPCLAATALAVVAQLDVAFQELGPRQKALFQAWQKCPVAACEDSWKNLQNGDSRRVEFAGGARALSTVKMKAPLTDSLDQIAGVAEVHGQDPSQSSQKQFNVEVNWKPGTDTAFEDFGWWPHIALLHLGQYGYQQDKEWNPFLGLVVLFSYHSDASNQRSGQFHIDFRSWFAHFKPDNGNIAANYARFRLWYGDIHTPVSMATASILPVRMPLPARAAAWSYFPPQSDADERPAMEGDNDIQKAVSAFLDLWYVQKSYEKMLGYIAEDNAFSYAEGIRLQAPPIRTTWMSIFTQAFENERAAVESLGEALRYSPPLFRDRRIELRYANPEARAESQYAIIEPLSLPDGSVFPPAKSNRDQWDLQAQYLRHLEEAYQKKLYVVLYRVAAPGLVEETVVQYWIQERGHWRIAAFQGTNW